MTLTNVTYPEEGIIMIGLAITFLIISLIAGALGFTGIAGASVGIAQFLFFAFLIVAGILFFLGYKVTKAVVN